MKLEKLEYTHIKWSITASITLISILANEVMYGLWGNMGNIWRNICDFKYVYLLYIKEFKLLKKNS